MTVEIQESQNGEELLSIGREEALPDATGSLLASFTPPRPDGIKGLLLGFGVDGVAWDNGGVLTIKVAGKTRLTIQDGIGDPLDPLFIPMQVTEGQRIDVVFRHEHAATTYDVVLTVQV